MDSKYFFRIMVTHGEGEDNESSFTIGVYLPTIPTVGDDINFFNNDKPWKWMEVDSESWELLKDNGITITKRSFNPHVVLNAKLWYKPNKTVKE